MKFMRKALFIGLFVSFAAMIATDASAGDPFRKLGRGVINVAFGALEIPIKIYDVNNDEGGFAAISYGLFKGIGYCVAREVIGVVEIVTFLMPLPGAMESEYDSGWGYGPLMTPEWIVDPDHDIWHIIYQDFPQN